MRTLILLGSIVLEDNKNYGPFYKVSSLSTQDYSISRYIYSLLDIIKPFFRELLRKLEAG